MEHLFYKILCSFRIHDWVFSIWRGKYGYAVGYKCSRCGAWAKDAIRREF